MKSLKNALAAAALVTLGGALLTSCSGLSEQDASDRCTQEQEARGTTCFDDSSFAGCVNALEECGDEAVLDDTKCPMIYVCKD